MGLCVSSSPDRLWRTPSGQFPHYLCFAGEYGFVLMIKAYSPFFCHSTLLAEDRIRAKENLKVLKVLEVEQKVVSANELCMTFKGELRGFIPKRDWNDSRWVKLEETSSIVEEPKSGGDVERRC
ncbi:hypothetical protein KSP40_PGU013370 [Platanthera guangdongensis]|uniref:Uncharacterized protein n=1 Tax=Platanthera guangdongensis TaxID=2320717 RepID=A0ABR2MPS3_9ASPA